MANRMLTSGWHEMLGSHSRHVPSQQSLEAYLAVAKLRRFANYLQTFPQVEVTARFGAAGASQVIQYAKQNGLHSGIVAFHSLMDGCYFRWRFRRNGITLREGDGGGIEIPTIDRLVADESRHGVECPIGRVQVVDRVALADGAGRFPFYMNGDDQLYAFDGNNVDYCPGSLALLVLEGVSHLFSPQWLGSYGESTSVDEREKAQSVEAENRRRLNACGSYR